MGEPDRSPKPFPLSCRTRSLPVQVISYGCSANGEKKEKVDSQRKESRKYSQPAISYDGSPSDLTPISQACSAEVILRKQKAIFR